jgi:hypothetical protein
MIIHDHNVPQMSLQCGAMLVVLSVMYDTGLANPMSRSLSE